MGYEVFKCPASLPRKGKVEDEMDRVEMNMNMKIYDQLKNNVINTVLVYMRLHNVLEALA